MPKHPHEILLDELRAEYKSILDGSPQAIYVYLDNEHKICNEKFAALIGYQSVREYETSEDPMVDVQEASINTLVSAYQSAMQNKVGSTIQVTWIKRGGGTVKTDVILVPIAFKGELLALHFITAK
jgi:PAS domain-containing protein